MVANLTNEEWRRLLPRPETRDPWTVKDALAHFTDFKADATRAMNGQPKVRGPTRAKDQRRRFCSGRLDPNNRRALRPRASDASKSVIVLRARQEA